MTATAMRCFTLACALVAAGCGRDASPPGPPSEVLASVTGAQIREHMQVLAADDMQGREAGTPAFDAAAQYVADRYRAFGIEPLGDAGSYFQTIEFFDTRLVADSAALILHKDASEVPLTFGEDFVRSGSFGAACERLSAPLAFAGFGITAPEYDHDDFAGLDVRGKILVVLTGAPARFATDQRAYYSSSMGKQALAVSHGALGLIAIRTPVDQKRLPWSRYLSAVGSADMRWLEPDGTPHDGFAGLPGSAILSESGAQRLFELAGHDLDALFETRAAGTTGSFDLGVSATLTRRSTQRRATSANVVGWLQGSDAALRGEFVVYTAHLDHLGIRPGLDGDDLHNGAYDNAAGVATVLEIAAAFAAMQPRPRRSILFVALTAEEKGLQGSDYFAHNPPVPVEALVANINIDMPYLGFPIADIEGFGVEHSTLQQALESATARLGLRSTPDPRPELVRFIRSDQYSFVRQGIPSLAFKAGALSADPAIDGAAMLTQFLENHYHRPSDDLDLPYSVDGAERFARAALLLGAIVAGEDERPRWNDGDFFGELFAERAPVTDALPSPDAQRLDSRCQ